MIRSHRDGIAGTRFLTATATALRTCPFCQART